MPIYRCTVKGCNFSTDSTGAFISHAVEHRLEKVSPKQSSKPQFPHKTAKEILNCPNCRAEVESEFVKRGYEKTSENSCPKCGEPMEKSIFGGYYCPNCPLELEL